MNAVTIDSNDLKWQPAEGYPTGAEAKVLSMGGSMAPRTILLKIPPGWKMDSHSHTHTELHFVLQGEYESDDEAHSAGTFRMIPRGVKHGPFTSKLGAIIMVTWCMIDY